MTCEHKVWNLALVIHANVCLSVLVLQSTADTGLLQLGGVCEWGHCGRFPRHSWGMVYAETNSLSRDGQVHDLIPWLPRC